MRLFSQLAQDCELKVGKVLWVAGHSGPETAEDSRTHFGIFETGRHAALPRGARHRPASRGSTTRCRSCSPRRCATDVPIVALHLTRPAVEIPDRAALGMPSHFEAARGAYVMRDFDAGSPRGGHGLRPGHDHDRERGQDPAASSTSAGLNVKIVAAISPQLFALQDEAYRESVALARPTAGTRWPSPTARCKLMRDWIGGPIAREYSLSSDWDDRWRTGGTVDEVIDEAHLGPEHIVEAIQPLRRRPRCAAPAPARAGGRHRPGGLSRSVPELRPHPYQHQRPRRPRDLPRRTAPPPERHAPPDLRLLVYVGIALAAVLAALATPYLVAYLLEALNGG